MRRPVLVLAVGALCAVTACGTASTPAVSGVPSAAPAAPAGIAATPSALAEMQALCAAVGAVYSTNMGPFARAVSEMAAVRERSGDAKTLQSQAQQRLGAFAAAIRSATQDSGIGEAQAAGRQAAELLEAKSADGAFFRRIQTTEDAEKVLGPTLKQWLEPVTGYCS
jgi:cell pole-organizing protein PopZ